MYSTQPCNTIQTSPTSLQVIYHLGRTKTKKNSWRYHKELKSSSFQDPPISEFPNFTPSVWMARKKASSKRFKSKEISVRTKQKTKKTSHNIHNHTHRPISPFQVYVQYINLLNLQSCCPFVFGHLTFLSFFPYATRWEILAFQDSRPIATEGDHPFSVYRSLDVRFGARLFQLLLCVLPKRRCVFFFPPGFSIAGVRFGGFNLCRFLLDVVGYYWMYHYHFIIMILTSVTRAASDLMSEKPCHSHVAVEERTHVLLDTRWFGGLGGFNQTSARTSDGNARLRGRYPQLGALNKLCTSLKLEGAKCGLLSSNMVNQYILRAYTYWFSMSEQSLNSYLDAKI